MHDWCIHRQLNATYSHATLKSSHLDSSQEKANVKVFQQWPDEHSLLHSVSYSETHDFLNESGVFVHGSTIQFSIGQQKS